LAAVSGVLALALVARPSTARPVGNAADATIAAATTSLIEQTHGCHRSCRLVRVPRWGGTVRLHRHVGPHCVPDCRRVGHQSHLTLGM